MMASMMTLFFNDLEQISTHDDASASNTERYAKFFRSITEKGIYLGPSQFEAMFVSQAHTEDDISNFLEQNYKTLQELK